MTYSYRITYNAVLNLRFIRITLKSGKAFRFNSLQCRRRVTHTINFIPFRASNSSASVGIWRVVLVQTGSSTHAHAHRGGFIGRRLKGCQIGSVRSRG